MTAGEEFRHFRASQPNESPGARYQPRIETPEWITIVHGQDTRYPVGALGLPVVMKDNFVVNADSPDGMDPTGRRSSPLWIRAVGSGRQWRLFSFAFRRTSCWEEFICGAAVPRARCFRSRTKT